MANIYDQASLVMIPSGTKTSKIFSQKPVNGDGDFTFSRSTAATRVNADGNIEKETQNLLTQSNNFDSSDWTKINNSRTGGQSGYDGTNDAWLVSATGGGAKYILQNSTSTGVHTFSLYAKEGTTKGIRIAINGGGDHWANFNLDLGTQVGTAASVVDTEIVSIGSGWYRISVTANKTASGWGAIYPLNNSFSPNYTAAGENLYIQDAQLEQGLVARDYIETTTAAVEGGITDNVPRLDYTDSSCPALLLEPQRTNVIESSEYFDGLLWSATNITITNNDIESPEGIDNASKIVLDSGSSSSCELRAQNNKSVTLGNDYTFSVFAKADEFDKIELDFSNSTMDDAFVVADLTNGTIISRGTSNTSDSIEDYGNGWYRITLTGTAVATGTTALIFRLGANPTGDGTSGFHIYGAQLEAGTYATSYIPTYGTSVTRNADANITITSASSIIGQQEGTFYLEIDNALNTPNAFWYNVSDSSYTNWIFCGYDGNNFRFYVRTGNSVQYDSGAAGVIGTNKIVFIYKSGAIAAFVNGTQIKDATTTFNVTASLNYVTLGSPSPAGGIVLEAYPVKQALLFPTAITDQEAIDLTTI